MKHLSKAQILAAPVPHVDVPHAGGHVRLKALTGGERVKLIDAFNDNLEAAKAEDGPKAFDQVVLQLIFAIVDAKTGERIFALKDHDTILESIPYATLKSWFNAFVELDAGLDTLKKSSN